MGALLSGCGSIDPGQDFQVAQVVFDAGYYYCSVEPMLFAQRCGSGEDGESGQCHFNVTSFNLSSYSPLVGDRCNGVNPGNQAIPGEAQANYQAAQRHMRTNPELAELLLRPTKQLAHPRQIFETRSRQADVVREWATRYSSQ